MSLEEAVAKVEGLEKQLSALANHNQSLQQTIANLWVLVFNQTPAQVSTSGQNVPTPEDLHGGLDALKSTMEQLKNVMAKS